MRQTAARLNRAWLAVIGVLMLLGGLLVVAIGSGLLRQGARAAGISPTGPDPSHKLFGSATSSTFGLTWVIVLTLVVGLVLGLLGLAWLLAQIPRSNEAKPFRLHDTADAGLTRCAPSVLTDAVEAQIEALPGVQHASAVLRGNVGQPDLTVKVTAGDRTDLRWLLHTLQNQVAADLGSSLDTQLRRFGVQLEIDAARTRVDRITV